MIELQHLTKRFATQGGTVVALNDINLTIQDGDIYGQVRLLKSYRQHKDEEMTGF